MKKTFITLLVMASFGIASSAHAFFDPINTPLIGIFGGLLNGFNTPENQTDDQQMVCVHVKDVKNEKAKKQTKIEPEKFNIPTLPMVLSFIGGSSIHF